MNRRSAAKDKNQMLALRERIVVV